MLSPYFALLMLVYSVFSFAAIGDQTLLEARKAYDKKNELVLTSYVDELKSQNYILAPYADYWLMLLRMEDAENQEVKDFLQQYQNFPFVDRVRGEWLKKLGKQQDWQTFAAELPNFHRDDHAVACYAAYSASLLGDLVKLEHARKLWFVSIEQPNHCHALFELMQQKRMLTEEDIWMKLRLALQANKINLAKNVATKLSNYQSSQLKLFDRVYSDPIGVLSKKILSSKTRLGRELNLYALEQVAKKDTKLAVKHFKKLESFFQLEEIQYFYALLATQAARKHESNAVAWFKATENFALSEDQLAWYVRAALRQGDWSDVLIAIEKMQTPQVEEAAWRYWKGRALKALNKTQEANVLLAKLAGERHYYGWLAAEEINGLMSITTADYKVGDEDVKKVALIAAVQRSEALQNVEMRAEAKAEWSWATQGLDDRQLLAAAEYAYQKQWYDLAIATADKTTTMHDFSLRYPTPFRDLMKSSTKSFDLDEAWVYGLVRQESRFMHFAKSNVGAAGLMQVMPATAKWVAKRAGWHNYRQDMIHDLDTNVQLGTYYMRYVVDLMSGQALLATAAYNAGPGRAKKWMSNVPLEGAIYAESIPFSETRAYVQKVMANAYLYSAKLGLPVISLKERMGVIPAIGAEIKPAEDATAIVNEAVSE